MADLSFTIDVSDLNSKLADVASATSAVAARSATWDKASAASSKIAAQSAAWESGLGSAAVASDAASKVSIAVLSVTSAISALSVTAASGASDAASAMVAAAAVSLVKTNPASGSRRVKRLVYTAGSSFKFVASSNAEA